MGLARADLPPRSLIRLRALLRPRCSSFPLSGPRHGPAIRLALARRWHFNLGGGAAIIGSYAVALWAMTHAPIATVAALRECSILFGILIARVLLGEQPHKARIVGGVLILGGAAALRLG